MAVSERLQKKFFADKFPGMLMLYMNSILTVALFYQFEMSARSVQAKQAFFVMRIHIKMLVFITRSPHIASFYSAPNKYC
jgi:hypothetical protein